MMKSFREYLEETIRTYGPVGAGPGTGYAHTAARESVQCDEGRMKEIDAAIQSGLIAGRPAEEIASELGIPLDWVTDYKFHDRDESPTNMFGTPVSRDTYGMNEGHVKEIDIERQDYEKMSPLAFRNRYRMSKEEWYDQHKSLLEPKKQDRAHWDFGRILELAGVADYKFDKNDDSYYEDQSAGVVAQKEVDDEIAGDLGESKNRNNK